MEGLRDDVPSVVLCGFFKEKKKICGLRKKQKSANADLFIFRSRAKFIRTEKYGNLNIMSTHEGEEMS